jgi:predicted NBD/HSP70 family sugar kinase
MRETTNHLLVLEALRAHPASSRPDLVRLTGLSRPTVSALVDELLAHAMLEEQAAGEPGGPERPAMGRPPRLLRLAPTAAYAIGLEFERDHVGWVVCDLSGRALAGARRAIAVDAPSAESIELVASLVERRLATAGIAREAILGAGVAIAAPIERPSGTLHADDLLPGWTGAAPLPQLEARLGVPVVLDNDANAGALGERAFGAGRGADDLVYVRLSSGVGAGLVVGGALYAGGAGMAGEIGHTTVVEDGPICRCGNRGCLEAVASPPAVAALLEAAAGEPVDVERLLALVAEGHRGAVRAVADAGELVGRALATTINVLNPRVVVLGGELAETGDVLLEAVHRALRRHSSPPVAATVEVRLGTLGEQAEVLGAAALVLADAPRRLAGRLLSGAPPAAA